MKGFILMCLSFFFMLSATAQQRVVSGKVTDAKEGFALPGVNVIIKGTSIGTVTDIDGRYRLNLPEDAAVLVFSFVGMKSVEEPIGARSVIDVQMASSAAELTEVVVTALGISREKKSLGYSTQKVDGDALTKVKTDNYVNSLSGKVSGVRIRRNNNFGGSTNVIIRGSASLTGNNQALFVIDGVPISNDRPNSSSQRQSGVGYDYGNLAADINPEDIESINVLKGAAAAALYGSRAANGVVMITTKKGGYGKKKGKQAIGVTLNSAVTVGTIIRSTFPKYQQRYGGGYGRYYGPSGDTHFHFFREDVTGDGVPDDVVPLTEDASYGAKFDPNLKVYQWDALYPESPNYKKATPWVDPGVENGPISFFETPVKFTNSISLSKAGEAGSFRLGYTNFDQKGLLPNSDMKRNSVSLNAVYRLTERLTATGFANFINTNAVGRNSTGYNDNILTSFRQWWQTNVNVQDLKRAYEQTGRNITWNPVSTTNPTPIFWDNPYWTRHKNYQSDDRNRFLGIVSLDYKIADWLHVFARAAIDTYSMIQEERRAVGSVATRFGIGEGSDKSINRVLSKSGYQKTTRTRTETNYALMLNFDKNITDRFNVKGVIGTNIRRTYFRSQLSATNGGINIPDLYSIQNTASSLLYPYERDEVVGVDGIFASASLGYDGFIFLDGTIRRDASSTLPAGKNDYYYPSVSMSFVFSRFIPVEAIHFAKFRANYATVGNSAPFDRVRNTYVVNAAFNGGSTSVKGLRRNPNLKPEKTTSIELGLEMDFLDARVGFDASFYLNTTSNQILPLALSKSTGYSFSLINAGSIENKGAEISAFGIPYRNQDFSWRIGVNWTKNVNKVLSLYTDESGRKIRNYQLGSYTGGVSVNATVGQSYGNIQGKDFLYTKNGQRVVNSSNGQYLHTTASNKVIGNVIPDWFAGITNTFTYKNISLSFLIDVQQGGSIFSLDQYYGLATGLYAETDFTNDLGNPVRNTNKNGGGFINKGVNINTTFANLSKDEKEGNVPVAQERVTKDNTERIDASNFGAFGYRRGLPNKAFVYDASYVKLREVSLSYSLPKKLLENTFLNQVAFSFVGSNLWIIYKTLPHSDPESGLGAGNLQGYTTGSLPTTRNFTFSVKVQF